MFQVRFETCWERMRDIQQESANQGVHFVLPGEATPPKVAHLIEEVLKEAMATGDVSGLMNHPSMRKFFVEKSRQIHNDVEQRIIDIDCAREEDAVWLRMRFPEVLTVVELPRRKNV